MYGFRRSSWLACALFAALAAGGCALGELPPHSKQSPPSTQLLPSLSLSAQSLGFGNVSTGASGTQSVLLLNLGEGALSVTQIAVTGKGFALGGESNSLTVQGGHTESLEITFSPTTPGAETGVLAFVTNDPNNPAVMITLSGTGVAPLKPGVWVSPASLAFGNVAVGSKESAALSIENTGTSNLAIDSLTTTGRGFTVIGPTTSAGIAPGASISVQVVLAPTRTGTASGTVLITTNATTSPIVIPVTGTAVAAAPVLSVSSSSISFGTVLLGALGSQTITLANTGTANLVISQLAISGTAFHAGGLTLPATIAPSQSVGVTVSFAPILAVLMNGSLVVSSNSSGSASATISLTGTGVSVAAQSVTLTWSASISTNVVGYNIYRSNVSGGPYSLVSGAIAGTSFTDTNVTAGQTYYYVLTSVAADGVESEFSGEAAVTVPGS